MAKSRGVPLVAAALRFPDSIQYSRSYQFRRGFGILAEVEDRSLKLKFSDACRADRGFPGAKSDDGFNTSAECWKANVEMVRRNNKKKITLPRTRMGIWGLKRCTYKQTRLMKRYPTDANPPMKSKIAPEFVLVPPDLSPSVANIVQPLAAAGNVTNVDILQHREA